jgi:autophagy-related protein 33
MVVMSTIGSYGVDYWFHRESGVKAWICSVAQDMGYLSSRAKKTQKKEEDLVVVEAEESVNGESVRREMDAERRLQGVRGIFSGIALAMGIVGLWGDRRA